MPTLTIPQHPPIDVAALQAAADAVSPGLATVTLFETREAVREPDTRPAYLGKNKLAIKTPCPTCGATGDVADAEGYPAACPDCHLGYLHEDPQMVVQHVRVDIGHRTSVSIGHLAHPPGVYKGRRDLFTPRSRDELVAEVRRAVGCAAFEVAKAEGGEEGLDHDRAMRLLDAAASSGAVDPARVADHRARRVAARARGVGTIVATHSTRPERETFVVRECPRCGRSTSGATLDALTDHLRSRCAKCAAPTVTRQVTRSHGVDAGGAHVQADSAQVVPSEVVDTHERGYDAAVAVCVAFAAAPTLCRALVDVMARESRERVVAKAAAFELGAAGAPS